MCLCLFFPHFFQVVWHMNIQTSRGRSHQLASHPVVDLPVNHREVTLGTPVQFMKISNVTGPLGTEITGVGREKLLRRPSHWALFLSCSSQTQMNLE